MPPPSDEYLRQRLHRIKQDLEMVGTLMVPIKISAGINQAIDLIDRYPDSALNSARKVLDFILSDLFRREFKRGLGTQGLKTAVEQLVKAEKLPMSLAAYANNVRERGNLGSHTTDGTQEDVVSALEDLMKLVAWYCQEVRSGAAGKPAAGTAISKRSRRIHETPAGDYRLFQPNLRLQRIRLSG